MSADETPLMGTMLCRNRGPYVQTLTGGHWYPFDPRPEDVRFADLRALSRINRYGGHTTVDCYTVAEHSVRVARHLLDSGYSDSIALAGLGHDAHEAYPPGDQMGPFLRAIKDSETLARFGQHCADYAGLWRVEREARSAVRKALGIADMFEDTLGARRVKAADVLLLATERRDVMAPSDVDWGRLPDPLPERVVPWTQAQAWAEFQTLWISLGGRMP